VNARSSKTTAVLLAILAVAVLCASIEAKLGLYYPEHSASGITAKVIKLLECRMERVAPELTVEPQVAMLLDPPEAQVIPSQPAPVAAYRLVIPRSHWFRPPPFFS
jgi:hypothetical protein